MVFKTYYETNEDFRRAERAARDLIASMPDREVEVVISGWTDKEPTCIWSRHADH